ncbi:MAG: hypothetical protein PWQ82_901 [Thermosediminibacterales bacterium]|nr:hypothetical protein [Thermosediminibacterales bacterium]MDK2835442.1 hypothetical protein [Thermosediminibacterales bacterium]
MYQFFVFVIGIIVCIYLFKKKLNQRNKKRFLSLVMAFAAVYITVSIIKFPEAAFEAAYDGLDVWFNIVFPALLPFFIGSQLLMGLGVVHFMGVLLEPFMRPLFNVPGVGSFVMAMGLASGYPIGAMLTGKLRRQNLCSKTEAERLMSFTNTADPLFMFGAVAVGMFHNPSLGGIIALAHYLSSICVGLILRFYKKNSKDISISLNNNKGAVIIRAFREMNKARLKDGRPFGELLGDCIKESINTMLLIGGFIILFSVIIKILTIVGVVNIFSIIIKDVLELIGLSKALAPALISGFFEITLGTKLVSEVVMASLTQKAMIASAIIAWSGLSVHAQVASMISGTDINIAPYIIARMLHAVFAAIITFLIMSFDLCQNLMSQISMPVFSVNSSYTNHSVNWFKLFSFSAKNFITVFIVVTIISLIIHILCGLKIIKFKIIKR